MHSNELDHIVLGCRDLASGSAWLEQHLGVAPSGGGQHLGLGTHNRLMSLAAPGFAGVYLELIALDPQQSLPMPPREAPFGLMRPEVQDYVSERPRIIHIVHRVTPGELAGAVARVNYRVAPPQSMSRGERHWQIALAVWPAQSVRHPRPTLIDWGATPSAGYSLPSVGVGLVAIDTADLKAELITPLGPRLLD